MNNFIHIFFTINNNYIPYLSAAIASILYNSKSKYKIAFHIISNDITDINKEKISSLKKIKEFDIEYLKVDKELFNKIPAHSMDHVSLETNYRFLVADIKPNIDKLIFLDADLIINEDIAELWEVDIDNFYLAGVKDPIIGDDKDWWYKKLPLEPNFDYINTGVLLINSKKWRENNIFNQLINNAIKYSNLLKFPDQDLINITLCGKIKYLELCWNYCPTLYYGNKSNNKKAKETAKIYHFPIMKPWGCYDFSYRHNYTGCKEYFWNYARMTPFYEDIIYTNLMNTFNKSIENKMILLNKLDESITTKINDLNNKIENKNKLIEDKYINLKNICNNIINCIAWWIPVKKWRDNFRNKIQSRAEQSRAEQSRAEQSRAVICKDYIYTNNITLTNKLQVI